ncbi:ABC transporter [Roseibium aquae]|uniref:ABC transporter n=1 Tax=Roseibium aquae TaxID=1323746 RepID=A0A916WW60_9HYPH|nr:ABC transporter substrate-binding protein [Roseibium aquae]GGB35295.1 ABC transporter [Roseibium aquae]
MKTLAIVAGLAASAVVASAQAESLQLTTLEWPPYVMSDGSGASSEAVIATFKKAGIEASVQVFPWNRAINLAEKDPNWIGVYPEYYSAADDVDNGGARCLYSASFGTSPVGFIQRADSPITWSTHDDLKAYTIGVVRGYTNEEQFDAMVAAGDISAEMADDDAQNILKVAGSRADAGVVDRLVFEHLAKNDPEVAKVAGTLSFNDTLLAEHSLHICFENSEAGKAARDKFNAALN